MCRKRELEDCEPTLTHFSVLSLLHAGRHECKQQTDFKLPYDIYWLKQHDLVTSLCCVNWFKYVRFLLFFTFTFYDVV